MPVGTIAFTWSMPFTVFGEYPSGQPIFSRLTTSGTLHGGGMSARRIDTARERQEVLDEPEERRYPEGAVLAGRDSGISLAVPGCIQICCGPGNPARKYNDRCSGTVVGSLGFRLVEEFDGSTEHWLLPAVA